MGIQICSNKVAGPFWPNKGENKENFDETSKIFLLMNHWPECIEIWHETSLEQGDSSLFK